MTTNSHDSKPFGKPVEAKPNHTEYWLAKLPQIRLQASRSQTERLIVLDHRTLELKTAQSLLDAYSPAWYLIFPQLAELDKKRAHIAFKIWQRLERLNKRY
jgi:hypothetical protein